MNLIPPIKIGGYKLGRAYGSLYLIVRVILNELTENQLGQFAGKEAE